MNAHRKPLTIGDVVVCLRASENLSRTGTPGRHYRILGISPKVRVTPGTGQDFLYCEDTEDEQVKASFNFKDVKRRT